jgi:hypothetical protein
LAKNFPATLGNVSKLFALGFLTRKFSLAPTIRPRRTTDTAQLSSSRRAGLEIQVRRVVLDGKWLRESAVHNSTGAQKGQTATSYGRFAPSGGELQTPGIFPRGPRQNLVLWPIPTCALPGFGRRAAYPASREAPGPNTLPFEVAVSYNARRARLASRWISRFDRLFSNSLNIKKLDLLYSISTRGHRNASGDAVFKAA